MNFGIRELLMFIGALIFVGVLVDGIRRFQNNRRSQIKLKVNRKHQADPDAPADSIDWYSGELPSGGARVKDEDGNNKITPRFSEPEDILMKAGNSSPSTTEPALAPENEAAPEIDSDTTSQSETFSEEPDQDEAPETKPAPDAKREQPDLFSDSSESNSEQKESPNDMIEEAEDLPEETLAINVIARGDQEIDGKVLLEAVLTFGLRYGDMDIFHRHEHSNGQGPVIFSMANALKPGTFDIETLPESSIKGVTFFMRLSQVKKRLFVLELMLDIAKRLANQLDAELRDDAHSVLSSQTVAHYKTRIQEYERKHLGQVLRH